PDLAQADPGGAPPSGLIQLRFEPGRGAPGRRGTTLVPDPHLPGVTAATGQRAPTVGNVRRTGGLDPAAVPGEFRTGGEALPVVCDHYLVGVLCPAGSRTFQPPAQPYPFRGHAERVHQVRAAQLSGGQRWLRGHSFVAPSVRPETK